MVWCAGRSANWDEVGYCSDRWSRRVWPVDTALEAEIRTLLSARPRGATITQHGQVVDLSTCKGPVRILRSSS